MAAPLASVAVYTACHITFRKSAHTHLQRHRSCLITTVPLQAYRAVLKVQARVTEICEQDAPPGLAFTGVLGLAAAVYGLYQYQTGMPIHPVVYSQLVLHNSCHLRLCPQG